MKHTPFEAGKYYHVFNRGNNKENIFVEAKNYFFFLRKLKHYVLPCVRVLSYCLMPNHFHLVIQIKESEELSSDYQSGKRKLHQPISNLFNCYAKSFNKAYLRTGSLFQEHLHRIEITDEDYLRDVIMYTHLNPENHGFISNFRYYPYSSFLNFLGNKTTLIDKEEVYNWFGEKENFLDCHEERRFRNRYKLSEIEYLDG